MRILILFLMMATPLTAQMTVPVQRGAAFAPQPVAMDAWQAGFRAKALAAGISAAVFDEAFRHFRYDTNTRTQDANQAEFVRPIWDYLDDAVSNGRVNTGRTKAGELRDTLASLERQYRVDGQVLIAIWGMESAFGGFRGNTNVISALANAAHDGRRRDFAEAELIAALRIIASGEISAVDMVGGWSGAMGHTQFMPSTYLRYAQDFNKDGRRNVWGENPRDALASSANYLRELGWDYRAPWGMEVMLPRGFDYALIGEYQTERVRFWNDRGVRTVGGQQLPNHGATALIAPTGANGPVFAVFPNFQVIRKYNMSVAYSLAVGHLSDRIAGAGSFTATWPHGDTQLKRSEIREIQERLNAMGLDTAGVDGMIGPASVEAIQAFQQRIGMLPDGYATREVLEALRRQ